MYRFGVLKGVFASVLVLVIGASLYNTSPKQAVVEKPDVAAPTLPSLLKDLKEGKEVTIVALTEEHRRVWKMVVTLENHDIGMFVGTYTYGVDAGAVFVLDQEGRVEGFVRPDGTCWFMAFDDFEQHKGETYLTHCEGTLFAYDGKLYVKDTNIKRRLVRM